MTAPPGQPDVQSAALTGKTDWDAYYRKPFVATTITRKFTENSLVRLIREFGPRAPGEFLEIGGANSCFFDRITGEFHPSRYHVLDSNRFGLDRMRERLKERSDVVYHHEDILKAAPTFRVPLVFSVGLIEHFGPEDTARAIDAHFAFLEPGGVAIITFPTPTLPYRALRGVAEAVGMWRFHDERPLRRPEVEGTIARHGEVLHSEFNWAIVLTQVVIVARKFR